MFKHMALSQNRVTKVLPDFQRNFCSANLKNTVRSICFLNKGTMLVQTFRFDSTKVEWLCVGTQTDIRCGTCLSAAGSCFCFTAVGMELLVLCVTLVSFCYSLYFVATDNSNSGSLPVVSVRTPQDF